MAQSAARAMPLGADGLPMTGWQVWLRRLCLVMMIVAAIQVAITGVASLFPGAFHVEIASVRLAAGLNVPVACVIALVNLIIGMLGVRGANDPKSIAPFFWIAVIDAVVTAWSLASSLSLGILDPMTATSGLYVIALAVCAWQVRGQTGYFDTHR